MRKVYETTTVADAELVRVLLRKHRIRSMAEGIDAGLRGPGTPITLWVAPKDAERALKVIGSRTKQKAAPKPRRRRASRRPR